MKRHNAGGPIRTFGRRLIYYFVGHPTGTMQSSSVLEHDTLPFFKASYFVNFL